MAKHTKRKQKRRSDGDRVLRSAVTVVIALFVVGAVFIGIRSLNPRQDTSEGMERLKALDQADVQEVEAEITRLDEAEADQREERSKLPTDKRFQNALVLGDFIAQGLYEQGVLKESFVLAKETSCVSDTEGTEVDAYLEEAVKKKPQVLFLELGINDAAREDGSADSFEEDYRLFLEQVTQQLPGTKIFVNSILPVLSQAVEETPGYADIEEYNARLKSLCREMSVAYIDSSDLVEDSFYKGDGKHMTKDYYERWMERMAEAAAL